MARAIVEDDAARSPATAAGSGTAAVPGVELDAVIEVQMVTDHGYGAQVSGGCQANLSLASRAPTCLEHPSGPCVDLLGTPNESCKLSRSLLCARVPSPRN
jgi:hypothetical protein